MIGAIVLRPAPADARTAALLTALGIAAMRCPLFAIRSLSWHPPPANAHDALLLTSANAVRHAGPGLMTLARLPVLAVGDATAIAARRAGLTVALTGSTGVADLVADARNRGWHRPLHLAGRSRNDVPGLTAIEVYASDALPVPADTVAGWTGHVALLHSPRAARRFAELVDAAGERRGALSIAALSPGVAEAAGEGWAACGVAARAADACLVATVAALIDQRSSGADKRG